MKKQRFPKGWDEKRVKKLIAELDARSDEEWVAADEAACVEQTVITVPAKLLPEIRRLLATHNAGERNGRVRGKASASGKKRATT